MFWKVGDCPDDSSTVSVPLMRVCPCPISGAVCFFTSANILIEGICCSSINRGKVEGIRFEG